MKMVPVLGLTMLLSTLAAQAPSGSLADQAVLAPVEAMFRGMTARDAAAMRAPFLPGAILTLMRDGKPVQLTIESFAERVTKPGPPGTPQPHIEERIHDPLVRADHDLALVWAPFNFLVDGKVDHCGTDLFNLVRTEGQWRISSVADTSSNSCPAAP